MKLIQRDLEMINEFELTGVLCKNNLEIHVRMHEDPGEG